MRRLVIISQRKTAVKYTYKNSNIAIRICSTFLCFNFRIQEVCFENFYKNVKHATKSRFVSSGIRINLNGLVELSFLENNLALISFWDQLIPYHE